jgi:hypothetical protein
MKAYLLILLLIHLATSFSRMPLIKLYFVRHAETVANRNKILVIFIFIS